LCFESKQELGEITIPSRRPDDFGQGARPGLGHEIASLAVGDQFAPQLGLAAEE